MTDPYQVLNVSSTASDDEVKKAYRDLARKYHPDNYHDNPLADLAQEKMKEINAAYDEIQRRRSGQTGGRAAASQGYGYGYQQQTAYSGNAAFQQVRMAIRVSHVLALASPRKASRVRYALRKVSCTASSASCTSCRYR